jgi:O-antigen ligase
MPAWKAIILVLALVPLIHVMSTWDIDGQITQVNQWFRLYSLPVVAVEILILILALVSGWKPHHQYRQLPSTIRWTILGFLSVATITSLFLSVDMPTSLLFLARYALQALLLGALIFVIAEDRNFDFNFWSWAIVAGGGVYVLSLSIFSASIAHPDTFKWVERLPSATNVRQIGNVVGMMAIVASAKLAFSKTNRATGLAFLTAVALLTFVMWSGTRAALLAFIVALVAASMFAPRSITAGKLMLVGLAIAIALMLSLLLPVPAPEFGMLRVSKTLATQDVSSGRVVMWLDAVRAISNAPLFGHGAGTYREHMVLLNGYPYNHPHNFILQFVYDWGVFGGGLALALIARLGLAVFERNGATSDEKFLAIAGFISLVTMALVEGTLFHPLPILLALSLIAPKLARNWSARTEKI